MSKVTAASTEASPDEESRAVDLYFDIETKLARHLHFILLCRGQCNIAVGVGRRKSY